MALSDLEDITEDVQSSLLYLTLEASAIQNPSADQMASHVGVSAGITTMLRALAVPESQEYFIFPRDIRRKYDLSTNILTAKISSADEKKRLQDAIYDIASQAAAHLDRARELNAKCMQEKINAYPVTLEATAIALFLEKLRFADFDIFSPDLRPELGRIQLISHLLSTRWRGSF
jgi:NADH dehydrogenase [ubiquinone] 1 alpha subcomplex assembly factor 6